jgi:hypothetical protein
MFYLAALAVVARARRRHDAPPAAGTGRLVLAK